MTFANVDPSSLDIGQGTNVNQHKLPAQLTSKQNCKFRRPQNQNHFFTKQLEHTLQMRSQKCELLKKMHRLCRLLPVLQLLKQSADVPWELLFDIIHLPLLGEVSGPGQNPKVCLAWWGSLMIYLNAATKRTNNKIIMLVTLPKVAVPKYMHSQAITTENRFTKTKCKLETT